MNRIQPQDYYEIASHAPQQERVFGLQDIVWYLKFAWPRILIAGAIATGIAMLYLSFAPRTYTATASVIFEPSTGPNFDQNSRWLEPSAEMTTRIESQVEVIKSEQIASAVVADLKLVDDPEFLPTPGMLWRVRGMFNFVSGSQVTLKPEQKKALVSSGLLRQLSLRRIGLSAVIEVSFTARTPTKAARVANAFIVAYIESGLKQKAEAARGGSVWLQDRLQELRTKAFDALREAELFKRRAGGEVSDSTVRLAELESVAQAYRRLYENFFLKFAETLQRVSYPVTDARLVSAASRDAVASSPKATLVLAFALALGAMLGGAVALSELALDRRVRDSRTVAETGLPLLGTVSSDAALAGSPGIVAGDDVSEASAEMQGVFQSTALTQLRPIHVDLRKIAKPGRRRVGIVSVGRGAGATTIAAKLAQFSSAVGDKVLLVDASVEDPALTRILASGVTHGLIEVMRGSATPEDTIVAACGCSLMPLVRRPGDTMTPGLGMNTDGGQQRLAGLLGQFDISIVDLSSMPDSPEARLIAPKLDGVVLVAQFGRTQIDALTDAALEIGRNGGSVLGVILNKCPAGLRI